MTEFALTLIAGGASEPLLAAHVDRVCKKLALDCKRDWLAPDQACDLVFSTDAPAAEITKQALDALDGARIDVVCAPLSGRRKKILISDMDSTIIGQECIDELGDAIGAGQAIRKITQEVINGNIGFSDALRQRLVLMKGMRFDLLERVFAERISLNAGARTLVQTMRAHGAFCILVSGGFSFFTSRIAQQVGFHDHQANELTFDNDELTGQVREPILGRSAKLETLNSLCEERGLTPDDVIAVGDGANDIKMIAAAGLGVAYHASESLKQHANAHIDHGDLSALLFAQGYRKSEFVTP